MPRPNRSVAVLCIAIVAVAAFLPGIGALEWTLVEPLSVLLPDTTATLVFVTAPTGSEQPVALLSLLPSRAPPAFPLA